MLWQLCHDDLHSPPAAVEGAACWGHVLGLARQNSREPFVAAYSEGQYCARQYSEQSTLESPMSSDRVTSSRIHQFILDIFELLALSTGRSARHRLALMNGSVDRATQPYRSDRICEFRL